VVDVLIVFHIFLWAYPSSFKGSMSERIFVGQYGHMALESTPRSHTFLARSHTHHENEVNESHVKVTHSIDSIFSLRRNTHARTGRPAHSILRSSAHCSNIVLVLEGPEPALKPRSQRSERKSSPPIIALYLIRFRSWLEVHFLPVSVYMPTIPRNEVTNIQEHMVHGHGLFFFLPSKFPFSVLSLSYNTPSNLRCGVLVSPRYTHFSHMVIISLHSPIHHPPGHGHGLSRLGLYLSHRYNHCVRSMASVLASI